MPLSQPALSRSVASVALAILIGPVAMGQPGGTAVVRHVPSVNGTIEGSVRQLLPESGLLAGNARITGDWLVPGAPVLRVTGAAKYAGAFEAGGPAEPMNYQITLSGTSMLGRIGQRTPSVILPIVDPPPTPSGTRDVTLTASEPNPSEWSTFRNLTLNRSGVDPVAVPAGAYGAFVVHNGALVLGTPGTTVPARYSGRDRDRRRAGCMD